MASVNKKEKKPTVYTHGGAPTYAVNAEEELCRAVMSCLLWEDTHYESGESIADRIKKLVPLVKPQRVAQIAIDARTLMKLRHVPLLIAREMARIDSHKHLVGKLLPEIIQRADELTELVAIYWKEKKQPLSAQIKKGLAEAFTKFDEYALGKYNQDGAVKLRDILFLVCPISKNREQKATWKKLAEKTLKAPEETWEVEISEKGNNKASWEKLLINKNMGAMAILRNLRNFVNAGVSEKLVRQALKEMDSKWVLPFRFLSATQHAPKYEPEIEQAMLKCLEGKPKLKGKTLVIIDVSGSMYNTKVSEKSEMDRAKAACSVAVLARELCENPVIYATAGSDSTRTHKTQLVPSRRGFGLSDAIYQLCRPLGGGGIFLEQVMSYVKSKEHEADRIIVITDEQDCSGNQDAPARADAFGKHNYIINVNTYKHGIGYGKWTHINGWSEAVLDYIRISEEGFSPREFTGDNQIKPVVKKVAKKRVYAKKAESGQKTNRSVRKNVSGNRRVRKAV